VRRWLALLRNENTGEIFVDGDVHESTRSAALAHENYRNPVVSHVATLVVETDDLPWRRDEPADRREQRLERYVIARTAEWLQVTGRAEPPMPKNERELMLDVIDAMRPIVEAAIEWHAWVNDVKQQPPITPARALDAIVDQQQIRVAAALSNWPEARTRSEAERMRPVVAAALAYVDAMRRPGSTAQS
jgi:hypothetical protein